MVSLPEYSQPMPRPDCKVRQFTKCCSSFELDDALRYRREQRRSIYGAFCSTASAAISSDVVDRARRPTGRSQNANGE